MSALELLRIQFLCHRGEQAESSIPAALQRVCNAHKVQYLRVWRGMLLGGGAVGKLREWDDFLVEFGGENIWNSVPVDK